MSSILKQIQCFQWQQLRRVPVGREEDERVSHLISVNGLGYPGYVCNLHQRTCRATPHQLRQSASCLCEMSARRGAASFLPHVPSSGAELSAELSPSELPDAVVLLNFFFVAFFFSEPLPCLTFFLPFVPPTVHWTEKKHNQMCSR